MNSQATSDITDKGQWNEVELCCSETKIGMITDQKQTIMSKATDQLY